MFQLIPRYRYRLIGVVFCLIFFIEAHAQDSLNGTGELKLLIKARKFENKAQVDSAIVYYDELFSRNPNRARIGFKLGELYTKKRNYFKAMNVYKKLYESDPDKNILALYSFGEIAKTLHKYRVAEYGFETFLRDFEPDENLRNLKKLARNHLEGIQLAKKESAVNRGRDLMLLSDDPFIATNHFQNLLSDGLAILPGKKLNCKSLDSCLIYVAEWLNLQDEFTDRMILNRYFFSTEVLVSGNTTRYVLGQCFFENGQWGNCQLLPEPVNDKRQNSLLPVIANESRRNNPVIYFVSDREEGRGGFDLWYTVFDERKGTFKEPKNLGSKINTPADEWSPYYDTINRELYFSSKGLVGYGGFDVFRSTGELRSWTNPEHLGAKVNSSFDDYFFKPVDDDKGVLASNRRKQPNAASPHASDFFYEYTFPGQKKQYVYVAVRRNPTDTILTKIFQRFALAESEYVLDENVSVPVTLCLMDTESPMDIKTKMVSLKESVPFEIKPEKSYLLKVDGTYGGDSLFVFSANDNINDTLNVNNPAPNRLSITINYPLNESALDKYARHLIDTSIVYAYHTLGRAKVIVRSYTDDTGSDIHNMRLSKKRARTVFYYLTDSGIPKHNIHYRGLGDKNPVVPNVTPEGEPDPEGRAKNRRTEITLELLE